MGDLNANKDLNIILQYLNPTGNGILRNPDRTRTRTRRKPGLKENPDSDSKIIWTRLREKPDSPLGERDSKLRKTGYKTAFRILQRLD